MNFDQTITGNLYRIVRIIWWHCGHGVVKPPIVDVTKDISKLRNKEEEIELKPDGGRYRKIVLIHINWSWNTTAEMLLSLLSLLHFLSVSTKNEAISLFLFEMYYHRVTDNSIQSHTEFISLHSAFNGSAFTLWN